MLAHGKAMAIQQFVFYPLACIAIAAYAIMQVCVFWIFMQIFKHFWLIFRIAQVYEPEFDISFDLGLTQVLTDVKSGDIFSFRRGEGKELEDQEGLLPAEQVGKTQI